MTHTVDTLMELADRYRDLKVGEGTAQTRGALRAALTEALAQPNITSYPEKDNSAQPVPPHECKTDAEKLAYAAGWWKALEANRGQSVQVPLTAERIVSACYSFRHDFGLLPQETRDSLIRTATDWAQAFGIGGDK